jgi:adenylate cyclase
MQMLSSKELMERAGISRATLNNYIASGLLPKPSVQAPREGESRARRIGYFPEDTLAVVSRIRAMKERGLTMDQITTEIVPEDEAVSATHISSPSEKTDEQSFTKVEAASGPRLTLVDFDQPSYLVNGKFEIEWWNDAAAEQFLDHGSTISAEMSGRSLFTTFFSGDTMSAADGRLDALRFHLSIAKVRLTKGVLFSLDHGANASQIEQLGSIYDEVEPLKTRDITFTEVNLARRGETPRWYRLYAAFFREGTLFSYVPAESDVDALVNLLSRRDLVIRDILKSRKPYLTPLAVLVADLQGSMKICAELPPEEYFEVINDIWDAMGTRLRSYYATHGKHVGDGLVYYFLPQPDCNYIENAVQCAHEMRETMHEVSRAWKKRKNWLNELKLNIGLDEGEEWFGTYQTPTHLEFTVLGDTINRAARLSDYARSGTVWVSKTMLSKLSSVERQAVHFGIRHTGEVGEEVLVPQSYARISNLLDLSQPQNLKFQDIAGMTVAEVFDVADKALNVEAPHG